MKVISVVNQKGGVGKSTTALCIGALLRRNTRKVLFVDLDAQGNLTHTLKGDAQAGINAFSLMLDPRLVANAVQQTAQGDLIPSTPALYTADLAVIDEKGKASKSERLARALELISSDYDYCVIDTPPALGVLTINALVASDGVIIPAQADLFSLQGVAILADMMASIKANNNPKLALLGVLLTRYNERTVIRREFVRALENRTKKLNTRVFKAKIRESVAVVEALALGRALFEHAPTSNASKDYEEFFKELISLLEVM